MTKIVVRAGGPLLVDGEDVTLVDANGDQIAVDRRPIALCRCGATAKKPFCDGTHKRLGFEVAVPTP